MAVSSTTTVRPLPWRRPAKPHPPHKNTTRPATAEFGAAAKRLTPAGAIPVSSRIRSQSALPLDGHVSHSWSPAEDRRVHAMRRCRRPESAPSPLRELGSGILLASTHQPKTLPVVLPRPHRRIHDSSSGCRCPVARPATASHRCGLRAADRHDCDERGDLGLPRHMECASACIEGDEQRSRRDTRWITMPVAPATQCRQASIFRNRSRAGPAASLTGRSPRFPLSSRVLVVNNLALSAFSDETCQVSHSMERRP